MFLQLVEGVRLHDAGHRRQDVRNVPVEVSHQPELLEAPLAQYVRAMFVDEGFQSFLLLLPEHGVVRLVQRCPDLRVGQRVDPDAPQEFLVFSPAGASDFEQIHYGQVRPTCAALMGWARRCAGPQAVLMRLLAAAQGTSR
jgi:hypothetical protein